MNRSVILSLVFLLFCSISQPSLSAPVRCANDEYVEWMGDLAKEYLETTDEEHTAVPNSLVIAMSALETGFGKSAAARLKQNFFGLRPGGKVAKFHSPLESLRAYYRNIDTHKAYSFFRRIISEEGEDDSRKLIRILAPAYTSVSESKIYAKKVQHIIHACNLRRFDLA